MFLKILFTGQQWRNRHREYLRTYGEGKRMRCMERVTWKLIIIRKIDRQWEFAVWLRKLKQRLCINLEGWDGGWKGGSKGRG